MTTQAKSRAPATEAALVPGTVLSDHFGTPPWLVELCERVSGPIEHDPFPDPEHQTWEPIVPTPHGLWDGLRNEWAYLTTLANPPFSAGNLPLAAERFAEAMAADPSQHRFFICLAAPGAGYWVNHLHPHLSAVAWVGRVAFIALRHMTIGKKDPRTLEPGDEVVGNRSEIAVVYGGPSASTFARVFQLAGIPVSRPA